MRDSEPDYSVRYEALFRILCLWVLPTDEALTHPQRDRVEYARHLEHIEKALTSRDWGADQIARSSRLSIEFGRRFYTTLIEWIDLATDQVQAGRLEPGGRYRPRRSLFRRIRPPHLHGEIGERCIRVGRRTDEGGK
jgi:hypothetical protein